MGWRKYTEFSMRTTRGWAKPSLASKHAGVSLKAFRTWFGKGLRYVRLPNGRILTKFDWIDSYLEQFEVKDDQAKLQAEELTEGL